MEEPGKQDKSDSGSAAATAGAVEQPRQGETQAVAGGGKPARDGWDKTEILLRPAAAFLTAVTVALIGWFGQQALDRRSTEQTKQITIAQQKESERAMFAEKERTRRAQLSQNYRLYTQLLSNREESESALRKDIFSSILQEFLNAPKSGTGQQQIRNRLLKLEILALNFGEALSLSPLFIELDKSIRETRYETDFAKLDKADDRKRLESLAKRVSQQQISALSTGGNSWDFEIPIETVEQNGSFAWPREAYGESDFEVTLEGISRNYNFRFTDIDKDYHSVDVELDIQTSGDFKPIERNFTLNFFNFPMVDNTRLSNDQRFALIMTRFENRALHFSAIAFPGKYSGQRDKPFLDDVIHRLRSEALKEVAQ